MRQILRKKTDKQILRQQKKTRKNAMRTDASKNNRKTKTIREQMVRQKSRTKLYENRCSVKKPAETVQAFNKKTGTPNKNSSWALCKLPV